jgi:DNA polymerase-3 subunit epsilon
MSWLAGKFLAVDTETTGKDPRKARLVTAAAILIDGTTGQKDVTEWLADPGIEIPAEATRIHGVSTEHARNHGRPSHLVVHEVVQTIRQAWDANIPVVGHNVGPYDLTLLECEHLRHWPNGPGLGSLGLVLDTLTIDGHVSRRSGKRNLVATARHYGVVLSEEDAHGSTADALASARILWKIAKAYPTVAGRTLVELFDDQISWHRDRAESLAKHFDSKGIAHDVCPDWPIRTDMVVGVPA